MSVARGLSTAMAAVSFVVAGVAGTGSSASAAEPADVVISAHTERGCPQPDSCTFSASGAIVDTGSVAGVLLHAGAPNSPVTGTAQYHVTFHGDDGSLTVRLQARLSLTDVPWQLREEGEWVVIAADGAYAGARGQGRATGVRDFALQSLDLTYSGQLQLP